MEAWLDVAEGAPSQGRREPGRTICLRPPQNARTRQRIHMPAPREAVRAVWAWTTFMCFSVGNWEVRGDGCQPLRTVSDGFSPWQFQDGG